MKNGVKSEISLQLLSVTSFSYTYFITYFISYFNENVLLTIIINRLSSTLKIVLINCQNFDLTNIYSIANLVQGTKIWNNSELSTPAYAAAAAYFGKTPPSFLKYGGVQHCTLTTFLESCSFKPENGHSVYSVGVPYEYMGSKSSDNVPPIPEELKPLFEKINKVQRVDGFMQFAQNNALARELSKQFDRHGQPDMLHLNRTGARVLAGLIKQSIFLRLNGGRDKRRRTGRVNGRLYSNVASNSAASQQTTSGG